MKNTVVALVYDFDETLSTTYMQDYVLIPELGMSPKTFWKKLWVNGIRISKKHKY
jgi:hypothetical protein